MQRSCHGVSKGTWLVRTLFGSLAPVAMGCTFGQVVLGRVAVLAVLAAALASPAVAAHSGAEGCRRGDARDQPGAHRRPPRREARGASTAPRSADALASLEPSPGRPGEEPRRRARTTRAALANRYDAPRALTLFTTLDANTDYLGTKAAPRSTLDIQDADGVVYPLVSQARASSSTRSRTPRSSATSRPPSTRRPPPASPSRCSTAPSRPRTGGLTWEYLFPFGGPPALDLRDGAGRRRAGVLARRDQLRRPDLPGHRGPRLHGCAGAHPRAARRPLGAALQLLVDGGTQRPAADGALDRRVRADVGRPERRALRREADVVGGGDAAAFRHRLLVALRARRNRGVAPLPLVRRRPAQPPLAARRPS